MYKRECGVFIIRRKKLEEKLAGLTDSSAQDACRQGQDASHQQQQQTRPDHLDSTRFARCCCRALTADTSQLQLPARIVLQMHRLCDGNMLYINYCSRHWCSEDRHEILGVSRMLIKGRLNTFCSSMQRCSGLATTVDKQLCLVEEYVSKLRVGIRGGHLVHKSRAFFGKLVLEF